MTTAESNGAHGFTIVATPGIAVRLLTLRPQPGPFQNNDRPEQLCLKWISANETRKVNARIRHGQCVTSCTQSICQFQWTIFQQCKFDVREPAYDIPYGIPFQNELDSLSSFISHLYNLFYKKREKRLTSLCFLQLIYFKNMIYNTIRKIIILKIKINDWYCVFCEIASGITFEPWYCIFYFKNRSCSGCSVYQQYSTFSNFRALRAKVHHNGANSDCNRLENCPYLVTVEIKAIQFYMCRMSIIQQKKRL